MKTRVILNPLASRAESWNSVSELIERDADVSVTETSQVQDTDKIVEEALDDGCDLIIAAGGDGAMNHVVNVLARADFRCLVGLIPLGTGNDLARSLGLPLDPVDAWRVIQNQETRTIDVIEADSGDASKYFVNMASGGLSGEIGREISSEMKATWGAMAYFVSAIHLAAEIKPYSVIIKDTEGLVNEFETVNVFIANCPWTGGGIEAAPGADPTDGVIDVVTIGWNSTWDALAYLPEALNGSIHSSDLVHRNKLVELTLKSDPRMPFNLDGEPFTDLPITFRVIPKALRIIVGPECVFTGETGSAKDH